MVLVKQLNMKQKNKNGGFLGKLLGTLATSLLKNLLTGKGVKQSKIPAQGVARTGNGVYLRNNLPKIKNGTYVINFDEYKPIGAHWIALYVNGNNVT